MQTLLVVNPAAGERSAGDIAAIETALAEAGIRLAERNGRRHLAIGEFDAAAAGGADLVFAYGGDGTVRSVAAGLVGSGKPLGILPGGTMNLLARDLAIPLGPIEAARSLAAGERRAIDVGLVGDRIFLCTSVLGAPARLARHREARRRSWRLGLDLARAALASVTRYPRRRYHLRIDGREMTVWTRALTVANNAFDSGFGQSVSRSRLDGGELVLYVMRNAGLLRFARTMLAFYAGDLRDEPALDPHVARAITVDSDAATLRVMNDGEVELMPSPIRYGIRPRALTVLVPKPSAG